MSAKVPRDDISDMKRRLESEFDAVSKEFTDMEKCTRALRMLNFEHSDQHAPKDFSTLYQQTVPVRLFHLTDPVRPSFSN